MRVKKRESLKRRFLYFMAANLAEMVEDVYDVFFNPYDFYGFSKYERRRAANIAHQLTRIGDIERIIGKDGNVYFRFTDKGRMRLIKEIPLLRFRKRRWDGRWRQVVFDIPEEMKAKREVLRKKLNSLGFGMLQRSVYITPFDVGEELSEFLEESGLGEYAIVFEMEKLSGESEKELASSLWNLDNLASRYLDFINRWQAFLEKPNSEFLEKFEKCREDYFSILLDDPGLPPELLPENWPFYQANKIFKALVSRVSQLNQAKKRKLRR